MFLRQNRGNLATRKYPIIWYLVVRDINIISVKLNLGIFSCKRCEHYFSQTEMFTSNVQFGCPGWFILPPIQDLGQTVSSVNSYCTIILEYLVGGGKLSRLVYLAPCPGFGSNSIISQFLLHHNLGIFSCKRCEYYFRQTEMFTSNVQFGYPCPRGGGQAVQAGLSCPLPGFGWNSVIS